MSFVLCIIFATIEGFASIDDDSIYTIGIVH